MLFEAVFLTMTSAVITGIVRNSLTYVPGRQYSTFCGLFVDKLATSLNTYYTVNWTRGELWTNIHLGTAVLCACLPTYAPLLRHLAAFGSKIASRFSSFLTTLRGSSASPSKSSKIDGSNRQYDQLNDPIVDGRPSRKAMAQRSHSGHDENRWEMGEINVKNTVHVV